MPLYKGHKLNMEWVIAETPEAATTSLTVSAAVLVSSLLVAALW